ncbi:hypothetical protein BHE74_00059229, partial [Ensete ventricosum]
LLRSELQPSTEHAALWLPAPGARALFDGLEDDTATATADAAVVVLDWLFHFSGEPPSFRSTEQAAPSAWLLPRLQLGPTTAPMLGSALCSSSAKSHGGIL